MEDNDFSDEFCQFVQSAVPSVQAAELLTVLQAAPERRREPAELQALLRASGLPDAESARLLQLFEARGLLVADAENKLRYAADAVLDAHVRKLAKAYAERPVTLIRMIYALRDTRIRSFADAFRFKRSK